MFLYDGNEVKAGGILFKQNNELLVQRDNRYLADFGGKVDEEDKDIYETIAREFMEEINFGIVKFNFKKIDFEYLTISKVKKYIQTNLLKEIYIPKCKYLLLIVNLKDNFVIDFETVGNKEIHDQIEREVYWLNIEKFLERRKEFHPRLWDGRIKKYFEPSVNDSFGFY